ncbi:hypothetical protein [Paenibacillus roseipurpureus]|uniref:Uncharacterized protein n=1 Tax=Paenibacillus roseopurpureus TaxID=2918901 RepID=A0AA96LW51_9BACL|nr:hypothetical protein [Paenibacillus sp. MBLB1832]WNR45760.1 hypothetical protein MJB10_06570 [Paenibacillus sp. MBLB1832]
MSSEISNRVISAETNRTHMAFLNQVEKEMNGVFKKFDELMLQYTYQNNSLLQFTQEELSSRNVRTMLDLYGVLNNLRSGLEHVAEIDFYNTAQKKIFTSKSLLLDTDEFGDARAIDLVSKMHSYGAWLDTRTDVNKRIPLPVITYIRPVNNTSFSENRAAFILYLHAVSLSGKLKLAEDEQTSY